MKNEGSLGKGSMMSAASTSRRRAGSLRPRRIVIQIWPQPALDLLQGHPFAEMVIEHLIAAKFADGEVFRFRMREVESADAAARPHRAAFGQLHAGLPLHVQQLPENLFLRVI